MYFVHYPARLTLLSDLIATGKLLDALTVHLFNSAITIDENTTLAALEAVEASFGGYAPTGPVVWGVPYLDETDNAIVLGANIEFQMTDLSSPQVIYGYWLQKTGTVDTDLIIAERWATPVSLTKVGQACVLVPTFQFGQ